MAELRTDPSIVRIWRWGLAQLKPFSQFGVVGLAAALIDFAIFNLLGVIQTQSPGLDYTPLTNKVVSMVVSTIFAWAGNRYWTFRSSRRRAFLKELAEFSTVALGGILISVGVLWFSHYVLGFTTILADNISTNVIGLVLATIFRYVLYRYWVFSPKRAHHA